MKDALSSKELISPLHIRPASLDDAELLWTWANDPEVRRHSFHREPISMAAHLQWYRAKLASPATRIWIVEENGTPVAQIRYDRTDASSAEIDYSVASAYRGRGLGTEAVCRTWALACCELKLAQVEGLVFASNPASARVFEKAGFEPAVHITRDGQDCVIFVRKR